MFPHNFSTTTQLILCVSPRPPDALAVVDAVSPARLIPRGFKQGGTGASLIWQLLVEGEISWHLDLLIPTKPLVYKTTWRFGPLSFVMSNYPCPPGEEEEKVRETGAWAGSGGLYVISLPTIPVSVPPMLWLHSNPNFPKSVARAIERRRSLFRGPCIASDPYLVGLS